MTGQVTRDGVDLPLSCAGNHDDRTTCLGEDYMGGETYEGKSRQTLHHPWDQSDHGQDEGIGTCMLVVARKACNNERCPDLSPCPVS